MLLSSRLYKYQHELKTTFYNPNKNVNNKTKITPILWQVVSFLSPQTQNQIQIKHKINYCNKYFKLLVTALGASTKISFFCYFVQKT